MPPPLSLSSLPPAVIDMIFHFAVPTDDRFLPASAESEIVIPKAFSPIALTSKAWLKLVTELRSDHVLSSVVVDQASTRSQLINQRNALLLRRGYVSRLKIEEVTEGYEVDRLPSVIAEGLLACVPHLRELHLQKLHISGQQLTAITIAAAKLCPLIHTLVFPSPRLPAYQPDHAVVLASAQAWLKNREASTAGLRHLHLCMVGNLVDVQSSNAYIDLVTTSCPNIEILDDAAHLGDAVRQEDDADGRRGSFCADWQIDLATWTRFCETCTHLTTFSWLPVPFATRFFEVFARSSKPQLKVLTLGASSTWKWDRYLRQVDAETPEALHSGGFGASATNAQVLFRACPQLRVLTVYPTASKFHGRQSSAMFDDTFWTALATSCPLLETLEVRQAYYKPIPVSSSSLRALASLRGLCYVSMDDVAISGDDLFELVVNHKAETRRERVFKINPSCRQNGLLFYEVLEQFLTRLANVQSGELPCASRRVVLQLTGWDDEVEKSWSAQYFERVQAIAQQAHARHPALLLKGVVNQFDAEYQEFHSIDHFTFTSQPTPLERTVTSNEDDQCERIDSVFLWKEFGEYSGFGGDY